MSIDTWLSKPAEAHRTWRSGLVLADRSYAEQSQRLYISLFGRFCTWLAGQQCDLRTIDSVDLARFLDTLRGRNGLEAANRTQRTYVAEIDRVLAHLQGAGLRPDNPARKLLDQLRITTPLRPRSIHLPAEETRAKYLALIARYDVRRMPPEEIQACAMNLLMLDCGLTLKELQKMLLKHLERVEQGEIVAPGHRLLEQRTLTITPECKLWVKRWLTVREGLKVVSNAQYKALRSAASTGLQLSVVEGARNPRGKAFVAFTGKSGRPQGMRSTGIVLDRIPDSTIYLSAQQVMFAGQRLTAKDRKEKRHKGPQALRTLCCARLVARGLPTDDIAAFMGLRKNDQVWAMARAVNGR